MQRYCLDSKQCIVVLNNCLAQFSFIEMLTFTRNKYSVVYVTFSLLQQHIFAFSMGTSVAWVANIDEWSH